VRPRGLRDGRAPDRTVRVGEAHVHRAGVVERLRPATRAVDQLVGDHERPRPQLGPQAADRARRQDLAYAQRPQRPQVRLVRDAVRRMAVIPAVPGEERDRPTGQLGDGDRIGRRAVRSVDRVFRRTLE
jgi:hypothetical protein